jgi:hypothetical protein
MRLEDRLYFETDDACAMCGARGPNVLTVHHIHHRQGESRDDYDNQIVLCYNCHGQYHEKGRRPKLLTRPQIVSRKRHLIMKTMTQYGLNALKRASREREGIVGFPFLLYHLVELGYMKQEEVQMTYGELEVTSRFTATPRGRRLMRQWFDWRASRPSDRGRFPAPVP